MYFQISEKYTVDGFLMFINVMVSMIKEGIVIEFNRTVECFGNNSTPWGGGTEIRRRTHKVSAVLISIFAKVSNQFDASLIRTDFHDEPITTI